MLFNEPKLLKLFHPEGEEAPYTVSVLFNEPKLLKWRMSLRTPYANGSFSALQRAEIAEIEHLTLTPCIRYRFSALQRAEIAEIEDEQSEQFVDRVFQCSSTSRNC